MDEDVPPSHAAIAGGFAGVVGTLLGFPLDSIKTRMQTTSNGSALGVTRLIFKEGGLMSFYRGVGSPLAALTVLNIMNFSSYSYFRTALGVSDSKLNEGSFEPRVGLAAAMVGPIAAFVSTPFEMVKVQMQLDAKQMPTRRYKNSLHAAYLIFKQEGISTLYRAHIVNSLREVAFLSTYFLVYEHTKSILAPNGKQTSTSRMGIAISGGLAGSIGWFLSFPLDSVKANIQGASISDKTRSVNTFVVAKQLLKTKGLRGLYSGVGPSIARAFIVSASRFSVYEAVIDILSK